MSRAQVLFGIPFVCWNIGFFRLSFWILSIYVAQQIWRHYRPQNYGKKVVSGSGVVT